MWGTKAGIVQIPRRERQSGGRGEGDGGGRRKHFAKTLEFSVGQQVAPGEDHVYFKIKELKPAE